MFATLLKWRSAPPVMSTDGLNLSIDVLNALPDDIRDYQLPDVVIARAAQELEADSHEMQVLSDALMAYLLVASEGSMPMFSDDVDVLWHHFILSTRDYMYFCFKYFDRYIHHTPTAEPVYFSEEDKALIMASQYDAINTMTPAKKSALSHFSRRHASYDSSADTLLFLSLFQLATAPVEAETIESVTPVSSESAFSTADDSSRQSSASCDGGSSSASCSSASSCSSSSCGGD